MFVQVLNVWSVVFLDKVRVLVQIFQKSTVISLIVVLPMPETPSTKTTRLTIAVFMMMMMMMCSNQKTIS
nr:hypothetical protein NNONMNKP_00063 [Oryctes rhinoceros nudivirus]